MKKYVLVVILVIMVAQARVITRGSDASMHRAIQRAQIDRIRHRKAQQYRRQHQQTVKKKRHTKIKENEKNKFH